MAEIKLTLKAARVNKGLTQTEAAKLIGITKDVLSNYERGVSYPNVITLKKIEDAYDVQYSDLIFLSRKND